MSKKATAHVSSSIRRVGEEVGDAFRPPFLRWEWAERCAVRASPRTGSFGVCQDAVVAIQLLAHPITPFSIG